jgi:hypothetical protein
MHVRLIIVTMHVNIASYEDSEMETFKRAQIQSWYTCNPVNNQGNHMIFLQLMKLDNNFQFSEFSFISILETEVETLLSLTLSNSFSSFIF